jgi:hypothetical protein
VDQVLCQFQTPLYFITQTKIFVILNSVLTTTLNYVVYYLQNTSCTSTMSCIQYMLTTTFYNSSMPQLTIPWCSMTDRLQLELAMLCITHVLQACPTTLLGHTSPVCFLHPLVREKFLETVLNFYYTHIYNLDNSVKDIN